MLRLYYIYDPMCSWCYAFDNMLRRIENSLPAPIYLTKILGGLAPDSSVPMPEPMQNAIKANWRKIELTVPHIQFNYDFWTKNKPLRSTYPACRAVLAAKKQAYQFENIMIQQIQSVYYQHAKNPSLDETLYYCARSIGLNIEQFKIDYNSHFINHQLNRHINVARQLEAFSYPSLILKIKQKKLNIKIDYNDERSMLKQLSHYRSF